LFCHTNILAADGRYAAGEIGYGRSEIGSLQFPISHIPSAISDQIVEGLAFHCERRGLLRSEGVSDPINVRVVGYVTR